MPFGVNLMRSHVLYRAAQDGLHVCLATDIGLPWLLAHLGCKLRCITIHRLALHQMISDSLS